MVAAKSDKNGYYAVPGEKFFASLRITNTGEVAWDEDVLVSIRRKYGRPSIL